MKSMKQEREAAGVSQRELANEVGLTQGDISVIEKADNSEFRREALSAIRRVVAKRKEATK